MTIHAHLDKQDVEQYLDPLLGKIEKFYETLWNNRCHIPLIPTGQLEFPGGVRPVGCDKWSFVYWSSACVIRGLNLHILYR